MQNKTFYELNPDKARTLIASMIFNGWTIDQIKEYFYNLGCGIFFVRKIVKPFYINAEQ